MTTTLVIGVRADLGNTYYKELLDASDRQHVMLLYNDEAQRNSAELQCIRKALASGQFCIYATVDADDPDFVERKLKPSIPDLQKYASDGSFILVNFKPFYQSAAEGDLSPFKQLKGKVEDALIDRIAKGKSGKALLVADAACHLSKNRRFDECVTLEGWWQDTYKEWMAKKLDISIICAHPSSVLKTDTHDKERDRISFAHSLTLDLKEAPNYHALPNAIRILVAEPEADIREIYGRLLHSLAIDLISVEDARSCLEETIMHGKDPSHNYDLIIIDTHMLQASGILAAKKILEEKPDQQIVFTSTWDSVTFSDNLKACSLDPAKFTLLQKPFQFSELLSVIRPPKFSTAS